VVIADGAVWIWNLAKDRFPDARQRLDLFHAEEHLWAVAHDLYGHGTPEAQTWLTPLLQQIRDDQTVAVIASLSELKPLKPVTPNLFVIFFTSESTTAVSPPGELRATCRPPGVKSWSPLT